MDITLNCPQCGGEVDLAEDDSVFRCGYCGSVLKPTGRNEVQSFFFPPKGTLQQVAEAVAKAFQKRGRSIRITESHLLYAPYWRVRGLLFQWIFGRVYEGSAYGGTSIDYFKKLRATAYHRTFPAFKASEWEVFSLGLRSQVMKMWPYNKEKMGKGALIIPQEMPLEEAVDLALRTSTPSSGAHKEKIDLLRTNLIGETYSLLFFPFYCFSVTGKKKQRLVIVDGLSHKVVRGRLSLVDLVEKTQQTSIPYKPLDFIPFKCPNCGWDLPFRPHTRIHLCRTCGRAWQELGGRYQEVFYSIAMPAETKEKRTWTFLPFWMLTATIVTPERTYETLRDFYALFPSPRVMKGDELGERPIRFHVPAFRIRNARAVDKLAAQLTGAQPSFQRTAPDPIREIQAADVWLPLGEAVEMAGHLLCSMTPKRAKHIRAAVKDARLQLREDGLVWLPFFE
jgi:ribosomal protein L37AE/L43A